MADKSLLIDGRFSTATDQLFSIELIDNFLFSEHIRAIRNDLPFWKEHQQLIDLKLKLFNLTPPDFLQNDGKKLRRQIDRTLVKNKLFKSAILHLYFIRNKSGISYILQPEALDSTNYQLNTTGLKIGLFDKIRKSISPLSSLDFGSELFWKLANADIQNSPCDELLILDENESILEAPFKNIYIVIGDELLTPAPQLGVYLDVSRKIIQQACEKTGLKLNFIKRVEKQVLLKADEIFLANSLQGIEWIKSFEQKRYFNKRTKQVLEEFNKLLLI